MQRGQAFNLQDPVGLSPNLLRKSSFGRIFGLNSLNIPRLPVQERGFFPVRLQDG